MEPRGQQVAVLAVVAAIVVAGVQLAGQTAGTGAWQRPTGAAFLLAATAALWWRGRWPVAVLAVTGGAAILYYQLGCPPGPEPAPFLVALFATARARRRLVAAVAAVAAIGLVVLADLVAGRPPEGEDLISVVAVLVATVALGELARSRWENVRQREAAAATAERLRLARELHDTLAHQLTVISLQAAGALHRRQSRPELAFKALAAIQRVTAEALGELRGVLGVIRADGPVPPPPLASPVRPGVAALPALAGRTGLPVTVTVTGQARPVPAEVDRTAFRIAQEALTNVVRHAGADGAEIRLGYEPAGLVVEVLDRGRGAGVPAQSGGHGLAGMRERAAALGGEFAAGPRPGGGFRVFARLPLEPA